MGRLYPKMRERPLEFRINYEAPLAEGLVFAGLCGQGCVGSMVYPDSSPYHNHGTLTNMDAATDWVWVPELRRWANDFDGVNNSVMVPDSPSLRPTSVSVCMFLYAITIDQYDRLFQKEYNNAASDPYVSWGFEARSLGGISFFAARGPKMFDSILQINSAITPNTWQAWAGIYNASKGYEVYRDGNLLASDYTRTGDITYYSDTGNQVDIGGRYLSGNYARCQIADCLAFSRPLTPPEVSALADPSNVDLRVGGVPLILHPRRRFWPVVSEQAMPKMVPWHLFQNVGV